MRWVFVIFTALLLLGLLDAVGRQFLSCKPRFNFEAGPHDSKTLFVYFPGILADGVTSARGLLPLWTQHGDMLMVSYDGRRFNGNIVAARTAAAITQYALDTHDLELKYDKIIFIGSSMGGLLSYDTYRTPLIRQLREDDGLRFCFVLIDAPTGRKDLQPPLDRISLGSWLWWAGPISNLFSKPYFKATFVKPKKENIEAGVDLDKLNAFVEHQMSYQLSWSMDQTRYIIRHEPLKPVSLAGANVVYVRSSRDDDTVRPEAFASWDAASRGKVKLIEVDSTHVGYAERPQTWWRAFEEQILPRV